MGEEEKAREELEALLEEHKEIDLKIEQMKSQPVYDQLLLQRMKRHKLQMKDRIVFLRSILCDDIIA